MILLPCGGRTSQNGKRIGFREDKPRGRTSQPRPSQLRIPHCSAQISVHTAASTLRRLASRARLRYCGRRCRTTPLSGSARARRSATCASSRKSRHIKARFIADIHSVRNAGVGRSCPFKFSRIRVEVSDPCKSAGMASGSQLMLRKGL